MILHSKLRMLLNVIAVLYLLQRLANGQITLTTTNDNDRDVSITILGAPDTTSIGDQWNVQTNSDSNDWSLRLTANNNTWGFPSKAQRFQMRISGSTQSINNCSMILTFTDGMENAKSKYFTIDLKLDDNSTASFNRISPGCGNLTNWTPLLNTGLDPYYTMFSGTSDPFFNVN